MKLTDCLARSQHWLDRVPVELAAGDYLRAARALVRVIKHAATAAAIHRRCAHYDRRRPYYKRRQLATVLTDLLHDSKIAHDSYLRTFHRVYRLPDEVAAADSAAAARRLVCHALMPVCRLRAAIVAAIGVAPPAPDPNAPSPWERAAAVLVRNGNRHLSPPEIVAISRPEARYLLR